MPNDSQRTTRRRSSAHRRGSTHRRSGAGRPTASAPLPPAESFADLRLPAPLLAELARQGVTAPFPIQAAALPNALAGRDVLGRGRTGSGKTLAFGLALLARTAGRRAEPRAPRALILVPTRELAQQVTGSLAPYADAVGLRLTAVVGGMSLSRQANALKRGADVVIATPGRLADLTERGDCRLDQIRITVLDEADQMTDMGFLPQVTRLLEQTPRDGQRMLFSATLDRNVDRLVHRFLSDPVTHSVDPPAGAVATMEHHLLHVSETDKHETTAHIAGRDARVIMFVGKKHAADRLVRKLTSRGVRAVALHGGKSQGQRNRALDGFHTGEVTVLVATNVAARGIHIDDLDLVVNIDPPADHKDYLHRGGRTARAGRPGTVVTLVLPDQRREMDGLMAKAGITPHSTRVRPGDPELVRITGARPPARAATPPPERTRPAASHPQREKAPPSRKRRPRRRSPARNT
ncbi:superfamily II DNA/RNA helicase [Actinomadura pelletieri DSM 43383]|uniref:Superfamily II DNA/RNA helicase n=1 Tax=Actinomadura pelletieri DSM 43383 TaxID=1120940 RepID=A0A495QXU9_9ACTN|nr:DEAD/DEAH box helicase [Actinomadura pelletieri]RKS78887.1 superfamily II DNA/RNA helicase [Actinomadura pelletieri DSM 43383]